MTKSPLCTALVSIILVTTCVGATADSVSSPELTYGARVRGEVVEQNHQQAEAITLKGRLTLEQPLPKNVDLLVQIDHVEAFLDDHHSDGVLNNGEPVIADPQTTELNQFVFSYQHNDWTLNMGRFGLKLANERFVGGVEFRQNDQTFDGLKLDYGFSTQSQWSYVYLDNVNRIFGDDADSMLSPMDSQFNATNGVRPTAMLGDHRVDAHLLFVDYREWDYWQWHAFMLSLSNHDHRPFSNRTVGVRAMGRKKLTGVELFGEFDIAVQRQQAVDDNPSIARRPSLTYRSVNIGMIIKRIEFSLQQEVLGAEDQVSFITPLATLHKFNGWADQFLGTPADGLIDQVIQVAWRPRPFIIDLRWHQYKTENSRVDIGEELNLDLVYRRGRHHQWKIRIADFDPADDQSVRTNPIKKWFLSYAYRL